MNSGNVDWTDAFQAPSDTAEEETKVSKHANKPPSRDHPDNNMLDPIEWAKELDRVSPQLFIDFDSLKKGHHQQQHQSSIDILHHCTDLCYSWQRQMSQISSEFESFSDEMKSLKPTISRVQKDSKSGMDKFESIEHTLQLQFKEIAIDHEQTSVRLHHMESTTKAAHEDLQKTKLEWNEVQSQWSRVKKEVEERSHSLTDMTPLLQVKEAIQILKADIRNMDVELGMLEHTLLRKKRLMGRKIGVEGGLVGIISA